MSRDKTKTSQVGFQDDSPIDELDEQLVAYLDGELSPEELRALEKRLGAEPALRTRLRELQNGWEMLDDLPLAASSVSLLETTIRMAAVDGEISSSPSGLKSPKNKFYRLFAVAAVTVASFLLGLAATKVRDYIRYRNQLRDLPIAMHLDAYLHSSDLDLMQDLAKMQQWKEANEIADTLGEWNLHLADQLDATSLDNLQACLVTLPTEDQKTVSANWERFEKISPDNRRKIYDVAARVATQEDPKAILKTMDRFAAWRDSLTASDRDLFASATEAQRQEFLQKELKRTTQKWTRERGADLSDDDVKTIYDAMRQIAKFRIDAIRQSGSPALRVAITTFEMTNQSMDARFQAYFLRRLFERPDERSDARPEGGPPRRPNEAPDSQQPSPRTPPFPAGIAQNAFANARLIIEQVQGPLRDDELYMLESILPQKLTEIIEETSGIPILREEFLLSWIDESIKRTQSNPGPRTIVERYNEIAPKDREQMDLLPPDRMLREIQGDRRRP